jgi:hypothetical protein
MSTPVGGSLFDQKTHRAGARFPDIFGGQGFSGWPCRDDGG